MNVPLWYSGFLGIDQAWMLNIKKNIEIKENWNFTEGILGKKTKTYNINFEFISVQIVRHAYLAAFAQHVLNQ